MTELEKLQEENKALREELEGVRYCATGDKSELDYVKKERDELLAWAESVESPSMVIIENIDETLDLLGEGFPENIVHLKKDLNSGVTELHKVISDTPSASLARRDARMKAEALRHYADNLQGADKKFALEAAEYYQDKSEEG
jgi:chromosome segregation ATPase